MDKRYSYPVSLPGKQNVRPEGGIEVLPPEGNTTPVITAAPDVQSFVDAVKQGISEIDKVKSKAGKVSVVVKGYVLVPVIETEIEWTE